MNIREKHETLQQNWVWFLVIFRYICRNTGPLGIPTYTQVSYCCCSVRVNCG